MLFSCIIVALYLGKMVLGYSLLGNKVISEVQVKSRIHKTKKNIDSHLTVKLLDPENIIAYNF